MGSTLGKCLKLSVFGESHGVGVGVTIDGFPAGMRIDHDALNAMLDRRKPSNKASSTKRRESDTFEFLSGVLDGVTTGAPICGMTKNSDQHSPAYDKLKDMPRPSHADYTGAVRYGGHNDLRGGGHFSGRLTAAVVFAGALAKQYLSEKGIEVHAKIDSIGGLTDEAEIEALVDRVRRDLNSVGGQISCTVTGLPAGIGSPMFDTVEGRLAAALFGVPAVKGVQFGLGFGFADAYGSEVNDPFFLQDGKVQTKSNNNGGVLGGITTGMPVAFSVVIKPTSSISKPQETLNTATGEQETLVIGGRHDPCIVPRAVPVIEAVTALTILDLYLEANGYAHA